MNSDKQTHGHPAKPFTPTLSAALHRSNKSPLTPKLATSGGYRTPKRLAPSEHPSVPTRPEPEPAFLSTNITPRSGSRSTRRDGSIPSPNNAPQTPYIQASVLHTPGIGSYRADRSPNRLGARFEPSRAHRAKTLSSDPHVSRQSSFSDISTGSPMFFHASDARSSNSSDVDARPKPQTKPLTPATFVYANGTQESQSEEQLASNSKRRSIGASRPVVAAKLSASPRLTSPKLHAAARLSDGLASISSSDTPPETASQVQSTPPSSFVPKLSIPGIRHMKSPSLDTTQSATSPREGLRPSPIIVSPSDAKIDASATSEPIPGLRPRIFSNESSASADTYGSAQSPVKSESNVQKDEVALNARTERKILDLEISNSSLLAINRTLEREMRKQNAELRRFRRLSRAGRLSMATSTRSVSGTSFLVQSEDHEGSELSSTRSPDDLSDFSDEESMVDEGVMSPDSLAEHDARHRAQDEKRFFIDLAKHQELLADSQKMNQSLRRCLGWTEELIKEGQKALEYNVHVNDVQLGGRVLAPEELHEIGESARGLLSPTETDTPLPDEVSPDEPTELITA
ncbi:hypothetical protein FE257_000105 [Aspergillus nanangensis]|uniref:Uncharacterized protein n=1 Tax=Aspergillus nanangensis TaxID=2582783 RepID=A0AAD4D0J1_ASPNN|nr:hypothetical protein FE257_000105 [Aspergillus nanangensis]